MLDRRTTLDGLVYYVSPLLEAAGARHGFSTRLGGVSAGPFASLNFGNPPGEIRDPDDHLHENHRRMFAAIGCGGAQLVRLHQVHGGAVVDARGALDSPKADGLVSDDPGLAISVRTADCVPVLLSDGNARVVAAVHAGWRGVVAGVVLRAVEALRGRGAGGRVRAAIGPCIGYDAFEVGPEVLEQFEARFGPDAPLRRRADGKGHIDLRAAIHRQLREAGLAEEAIDATDRCTFRDGDEFFSHRREKGLTGRMIAVIAAKA
jgi:YfiH family protein